MIVLKNWDHAAWPGGRHKHDTFWKPHPEIKSTYGLEDTIVGDPEEDLSDSTWGDETRRVCLLLTHARHFGQILLTTTV